MSIIKFDHVSLPSRSAQNFPENLEPAVCTAASKAKEKTAFKEQWQEDMKTARSIWDSLHSLYARTDIFAQFDLRDHPSSMKFRDYQDLDQYRYLEEFKDAHVHLPFETVHHIIRGKHYYRDDGRMAGQGQRTKAAAAKSGKTTTDHAATFTETLGDDRELSCASIDNVPKELAELVVNSWSTLLDIGATSHLDKDRVLLSKTEKPFGHDPMVNKLFALEVELLKPPGASLPSSPFSAQRLATNHFLTSGHVILGENIEYNSIHSLSGATSTQHDYSSLSFLERPDSEVSVAPDLPPNASNLEEPALRPHNFDTTSALEPSSRAHSPPVDASVPVSRLLVQPSTPAPVRMRSREHLRVRKLTEKGQPFERRAEVNSLLLNLLHVYMLSHLLPSPPAVRQLLLPPSRPAPTISACTAPVVVSPAVSATAGVRITFGVGRITTHVESVWRLRCGGKDCLARVRVTAARRGGVESRSVVDSGGGGSDPGNARGSDAEGNEDENPFAVLCSKVLNDCTLRMDSAAMAALKLDADDYLQRDVDGLCKATLLSIRSDVHRNRNPQVDGYAVSIPLATHREAERRTDAAEWRKVMEKEVGDLKRMGVCDELPEGKKPIGCRWIYEFKIDESGCPPIYKTRFTMQGFSQVLFVDYGATFAPIARSVTVQFVAVYSASQGWHLQCFNTTRAFMWDLIIVIFMCRLPPLPLVLCRLVMWIHQEIYIDFLLTEHDLVTRSAVVTPLDPSFPLRREDATYPIIDNLKYAYQHLIGSLLFLQLCSRSDISFADLALFPFCSSPLLRHYPVARCVLCYIKGTKSFCLHYSGVRKDEGLSGLSDPDWTSDKLGRASISGFVWSYGGGPISAERMGGSSGGGVDDNPFAALCNNGVLDEYMSTMDSAMAASLDANDYFQRDIDSPWEAMLLSVRRAFIWALGGFHHRSFLTLSSTQFHCHTFGPLSPSLLRARHLSYH
jgi:hypothetical protein